MKKKEKILRYILIGVTILASIIFIIVQINHNKHNEELEREKEKLNILEVKTNSGQNVVTQYMNFEEEKFFIKIPTTFRKLDDDTISKKYYGDVPQIVFSNDDISINILVNMTDNDISNDEIKDYQSELIDTLENNGRVIYSNYYEVDNHNIGKVKFISNSIDTKIFNNTTFFSYNNKLVIISFNCTGELQEEWQDVSDFIIDSLFFSE